MCLFVFNLYFKAIDRDLLRESKLIKKLLRNVIILSVVMGLYTALNTQNIVTGKFLTLSDGTELTGAGIVESTVQLWGYLLLSPLKALFRYRSTAQSHFLSSLYDKLKIFFIYQ